jgi:predicted signal transduction protein with EAL and GGDEF domain
MSLDSDEDDRSIVRSTIELAHDLGLTTVAEGVESANARDWLAAHGCDVAQGRLSGMAVPSDEFERLVARNTVSLVRPDRPAAPQRIARAGPGHTSRAARPVSAARPAARKLA